jgi:hypothetical protein
MSPDPTGTRVRDLPGGRDRIRGEIGRYRRWCAARGIASWPTEPAATTAPVATDIFVLMPSETLVPREERSIQGLPGQSRRRPGAGA